MTDIESLFYFMTFYYIYYLFIIFMTLLTLCDDQVVIFRKPTLRPSSVYLRFFFRRKLKLIKNQPVGPSNYPLLI